jgi:hypothetical protein
MAKLRKQDVVRCCERGNKGRTRRESCGKDEVRISDENGETPVLGRYPEITVEPSNSRNYDNCTHCQLTTIFPIFREIPPKLSQSLQYILRRRHGREPRREIISHNPKLYPPNLSLKTAHTQP